ncbi:MAG TPA: aminomethyl-transferring glycine dehydrogenase subunit GcvPA [Deltaproteobacteria bacterium]|nr:MAG: glycine dehydrogenase (aminomethyl-transferring) [Deltaproteobacteria bacterium GWA2_45_12]HBF14003.1 aminomethyl-transferring glycine dehydrogenase subunit GcvPA [Deltaproteobacteria bacterium]
MRYLPHTKQDIKDMLQVIGKDSVDALFESIPEELRLKRALNLPKALSEMELRSEMLRLSKKNVSVRDTVSFLGGGAYNHYVPSPISQLINRGEFFTAYTPYQPEVSQGTLQALFEFQTMICELTGMEIANASNYDASTGCAEALLMSARLNGRKKALVARSVHPQYRKVMRTYLSRFGYEIVEVGYAKDGSLDWNDFEAKCDASVGAVMVGSPNFFGVIEDLQKIGARTKQDEKTIFITVASEPLSMALLNPPGSVGADIAVAEGQSFGVGLSFGGPYLGLFATQQKYIRAMPGRIVGETVDVDGKRGFVLTFSTREQHIRREKATSNICTNQGLCALMSTIYLSLMGKEGLTRLAQINLSRATYAKEALTATGKVKLLFDGPTFNEFVICLPDAQNVLAGLKKRGIFAGIWLPRYYKELKDAVLVCVTEMNSKEQIDLLVSELKKAVS